MLLWLPRGPQGPTGAAGAKGDKGDTGDTGPLYWQGAWSDSTTYVVGDAVENDGSSYVCILGHTNQEPPNATYWDLLSSKGDTGETGAEYNFSGDPSSYHFDKNDFTTDEDWHVLDISSYCTKANALVHIMTVLQTATVQSSFHLRTNGQTNQVNIYADITQVSGQMQYKEGWVLCDSSRYLEYWISNVTWQMIYLTVRGWF